MNYKIVYDNSLQHFGILGMKWGKRNSETLARYARERRSGKTRSQALNSIKKDKANTISNVNRQVRNVSQNASNIARRFEGKGKQKTSSKVKKMSDDELRRKVNRMNLEKQYNQLKSEELNKGKITASDILDTIGDVAAISASLATIYMLTRK